MLTWQLIPDVFPSAVGATELSPARKGWEHKARSAHTFRGEFPASVCRHRPASSRAAVEPNLSVPSVNLRALCVHSN